MPHRRIPVVLAVLTVAALTANATDFWLAKGWRQWSKHECGALLSDSPWAHTWKGGRAVIGRIGPSVGTAPQGVIGTEDQLEYIIQVRSSLPVR
jgi:hypothetical protein